MLFYLKLYKGGKKKICAEYQVFFFSLQYNVSKRDILKTS